MLSYVLLASFLVSCTKEVDDDDDGVPLGVDCDDADANVGGPTSMFADADEDGFGRTTAPTEACAGPGVSDVDGDCNDADATFYPGAPEEDCTSTDDKNCDGSVGAVDADGDRYYACEECDDADPTVHPGSTELCNEKDDDCDGTTDEEDAADASTWYEDIDRDGYGTDSTEFEGCQPGDNWVEDAGDCDDDLAAAHPYAEESCEDSVDLNCDGSPGGADLDADGFFSCEECDDSDPNVNPTAIEVCNGLDDDCDGTSDNDTATDAKTWYFDADRDGFGDPSRSTVACEAPAGYVADATDCNDLSAAVNPSMVEICDSADADEDCNGSSDDADAGVDTSTRTNWYIDRDADGHADPTDFQTTCDASGSYTFATADDCDDTRDDINPDMDEICDTENADEDCSGAADNDDSKVRVETMTTFYNDLDDDGHGDPDDSHDYCDASGVYDNLVPDDCNDERDDVNPDMTEICDEIDTDEDCSGAADDDDKDADESTMTDFYADEDGDGHADPDNSITTCDPTTDYLATSADDCDDTRADVSPSDVEVCDTANTDEDCDGKADDNDTSATGLTTWYADGDGDLYADPTDKKSYCDAQGAYRYTVAKDCNDDNTAINPGATEICDSLNTDEDCDGLADNSDSSASSSTKTTFYVDSDFDTYGNSAYSSTLCDATTTYSATVSTDCDDTRSDVNPGATEVCDSLNTDEDCDSLKEDADPSAKASTKTTYYADIDADGYGGTTGSARCDIDATYKYTTSGDCDDSNSAKYPSAPEFCDGAYNDCSTSSTWTSAAEANTASVKSSAGVWTNYTSTLSSSGTGGTVAVPAGGTLYMCTGSFAGRVTLATGASVVGKGSTSTTLDGKASGSVVSATGTTSIKGLKITNGAGTLGGMTGSTSFSSYTGGGGILVNSGTSTIDDVIVTANTAGIGGGIGVNIGATANISNATISNNEATYTTYGGGGIGGYGAGTTIALSNVSIANNKAGYGGGIGCEISCKSLSGTSVEIKNNTSTYGAGFYWSGASGGGISLPSAKLTGNAASSSYGGAYISSISGTSTTPAVIDFTSATVTGNSAGTSSAGGLYISGGTYTNFNLSGVNISSNTAGGSYGGMYLSPSTSGNVDLSNATISSNSATSSYGGLYTSASSTSVSLNMTGATINGNTSGSTAGGMYLAGTSSTSTINLSNIKVTNNTATSSYGGMYVSGPTASATVNLSGATITGNSGSLAGGIYFSSAGAGSTTTLTNATISSNAATGAGGGLYCSSCLGTLDLTGATISGNTAATSGGGLYLPSSTSTTSTHTITLSGTTVTNNKVTQSGTTAASGGGIYLSGASATLNIGASSNISNNKVAGTSGAVSGGGLEILGSAKASCDTSTIKGNTVTGSGTVVQGGGARISSTSTTAATTVTTNNCDWGTDGASDDNSPTDVQLTTTSSSTNEVEVDTGSHTCTVLSTGGSCT